MTFKDDLLRFGSLPEDAPPFMTTEGYADAFEAAGDIPYFTRRDTVTRTATYTASKRGFTRRAFGVPHPATLHDAAKFCATHEAELFEFFRRSASELSIPVRTPGGGRAIAITSPARAEEARFAKLAEHRFIVKTDISRFYPSAYTHSVPWAYHGREAAKRDRNPRSAEVFFNRIDLIIRNGQDGQTIGIPVGPDSSRLIAEVISTAIDRVFEEQTEELDVTVIRVVDDVWIGAHTLQDAELSLSRYRHAIRSFELDINDSKTHIYDRNFEFASQWAAQLEIQFDEAFDGSVARRAEKLRALFDRAMRDTINANDDAIVKRCLRLLDRRHQIEENWSTVEPFLKRCVVLFGHSIDYAIRVLLWFYWNGGDIDEQWPSILLRALRQHAALGHDNEVCWLLFATSHLDIEIPQGVCSSILADCGPMTCSALLTLADQGRASRGVFEIGRARLNAHSAPDVSEDWPLLAEWLVQGWQEGGGLEAANPAIQLLTEHNASLFEIDRQTRVFEVAEEGAEVREAIERRTSIYDDDEFVEDEPDADE